ncbi:MAG: pitrilysin family protein [Tunicatimonas sp.]
MKSTSFGLAGLLLIGLLTTSVVATAQDSTLFSVDDIDISYQEYTLDNGLRLIVHEDHKAPIVAVNVWYHVGSKNEKPGKSGFAHLFEHLMFNGSENFNDDYFQALERIGGTDLNGTTNNDRTNYFQNVPTAGLDQVLWLESDRMGHLLGAIDSAKLDEQRGVVQNEKRQGENQPYGRERQLINDALWPEGHPYSWTVIGSMEDLNAASLDDVHEWFKTYYGAANAVLSIAGDVDPDDVHERVKKYFGSIAPGPTLARPQVNVAKRTEDTRQTYEDRVPEARITQVWNVPQWGTDAMVYLDLASDIMAAGKTSRLYKKLQYEDQQVSSVSAYVYPREIAGTFTVRANVKPGESVEEVEQKLGQILQEFIDNGPTQEELDKVKSAYFANFIKRTERIGGFGGKSDLLAINEVYGGRPDYYEKTLSTVQEATVADIQDAVKTWLSNGKHTLVAYPYPEYQASDTDADRSQLPEMGEVAAATFPALERTTLSNGLDVVLARRAGVPTVVMNLVVDAGYAADQGGKPGTASLALSMMDEGTEAMDALQISEELQTLGASLSAYSDLDASYVSLTALKPVLDQSLGLYADVILNPAFPAQELDRLKKEQVSGIQREKTRPFTMALRVAPKLMYGEQHPYGNPLTGSGYEETVQTITRDDLTAFYNNWFKPNNATLTVVGDLSLDELTEKLERRFAAWKQGEVPQKNIAEAPDAPANVLYLMDRPESQQSIVIGGYLTDPYGQVDELAKDVMNDVLGGDFTSRVNMNLREDKHWAYGAGSFVWAAKGQRPYLVYAPVQTDKTKESIQEIQKEFDGFVGDHPIKQEEFDKVQKNSTLQLSGRWETNRAVGSSLNEIVKYDLADDYFQTYGERMKDLSLDDARALSKQMVQPQKLQWFVVGDKEKVLPGLKELGMDRIVMIDADGNVLEPAATIEQESDSGGK